MEKKMFVKYKTTKKKKDISLLVNDIQNLPKKEIALFVNFFSPYIPSVHTITNISPILISGPKIGF